MNAASAFNFPDASLPGETIRPRGPRSRDEWFLTNGLGGFASGTAACVPERRYHAWFIPAMSPPVGRMAAVQACAEWLVLREPATGAEPGRVERHDFSSFRYTTGMLSPQGAANLVEFRKTATSVAWTYNVAGLRVTRELFLARHRNAASVRYTVSGQVPANAALEVRPLLAMRDFHDLQTRMDAARFDVATQATRVQVVTKGLSLAMLATRGEGNFARDDEWWSNFFYVREQERGQDAMEHLYSPGVFVFPLHGSKPDGHVCEVQMFAGEVAPAVMDVDALRTSEHARLGTLASAALKPMNGADAKTRDAVAALAAATDQFVVRRANGDMDAHGVPALTSIIAGYPWFSDWGRDTCISLPGLLLSTGRFAEALGSLRAFAALRRRGLIPNCFDNGSGTPEYNTVDASLWFIVTCCRYLEASGDREGFNLHLRQACLDIVDAYRTGTDYGIRMDDRDGLIIAGNATTQLTWMDAKRDGVVFTPRFGKPVEISALWYAGLMMLEAALEKDQPKTARELAQLASKTAKGFEQFWDASRGCLFDCLVAAGASWTGSAEMRPNQLFAVSLPYSALSRERQKGVVSVCERDLLTPFGLRTLAAGSPKYRPRFEGPLFERDGAYHNGTVWPWLLGPFCEAYLRVSDFSVDAKRRVRGWLTPLIDETLATATTARAGVVLPVRQVAEVYDADDGATPRRPDGCMAQAWSAAELLRVLQLTA
jgi:predicted glycogen debranching enzyme